MILTPMETMGMILAVALGTMVTRFTPFILFPENKHVPEYVLYLGKVLPAAMMGLLVVYCFKGVALLRAPYGIPEVMAVLCIVLLHRWKNNVLVSIGVSTVFYMFLVQTIFI